MKSGGKIFAEGMPEGMPEGIGKVDRSCTGQFLKELLERRPQKRVEATK